MRRFPRELIGSLAAILALTGLYLYVARQGVPQPSGWVGHGLGIVGFVMMLSTEIVYTLRKRLRRFTMGSMSTWLQVHIVTGIVGPYLVLLHSGWRFQGLAGVVTLLTVVMVVSGFVGRYIYTAVPRTLEGEELGIEELEKQMAWADRQLQALGNDLGDRALRTPEPSEPRRGWILVLGRALFRWRQQRQLRRTLRELNITDPARAVQFEELLAGRHRLQTQIRSLAATRRLLALWHLFHIPLGAVLFTLAFIHIGAALYYATFLK